MGQNKSHQGKEFFFLNKKTQGAKGFLKPKGKGRIP